jgi:hypothetical protein
MQISPKYEDYIYTTRSSINTYTTNNNLNSNNTNTFTSKGPKSSYKVFVFDIEDESGILLDANFRIIKDLDGFSQLNFNNCLYICGSDLQNSSAGSHLLKFDANLDGNKTSLLINSTYNHYYPTLIGYKTDMIIAIGGFKTKSTEIFNARTNRWRNLPELPEERYKCSAISDESLDYVYIFGGLNTETGKNCSTILRLNMKTSLVWETIIAKHSGHLLMRNSSAIIKYDRSNSIFIIGGRDNDESISNNIVEYDFHSKIASLSTRKLELNSCFFQTSGSDLNKNEFFLFDDKCNIHKLSRNDFKVNFFEMKTIFDDQMENI